MSVDSITLEIIRNALTTIAKEMTLAIERTSRSPAVNECRDFATVIMDSQGQLIAQGLGAPSLMAATKHSVQAILEDYPDDFHAGDVVINNDPYRGGSHLGDTTLAMPVFHEGNLLFLIGARAHLPDATGGGARVSGIYLDATEIMEEGLRFPPLKLHEAGVPNKARMDWLLRNCRFKAWTIGDINAMLSACHVGEARILSLIEKYGALAVTEAADYSLDYAERLFRAEVASWKDGVYEGAAYMDSDGYDARDVKVHVRLIVDGDHLTMDFSGTDKETLGFANSGLGNSLGYIFLGLSSALDESIPKNDGLFRVVELNLPLGSVVNPYDAAPTGVCTLHPGAEITQAVTIALAQIIPERVGAPWDTRIFFTFTGADPRDNAAYQAMSFIGLHGGPGATHGLDGWGGGSNIRGGMPYTTPEMFEFQFPEQVESREFIQDTAGPGEWRGGCGIRTVVKAVGHSTRGNALVLGGANPAPGLCGGLPGAPNKLSFLYVDRPDKELPPGQPREEYLNAGEGMSVERGGGGGWGNPMSRDPELVREDVIDEYVSFEGALRDYGVALDEETLEIDAAATEEHRQRRRAGAFPSVPGRFR
ncbi:MAG: N-methylhydantoinase B [Chloroflexi bacterium]|nr:MAG: N-methylhydantoinase B [Chloroflexota bacterium]